jgi:steroid delta-isomerase-like uncharacterized protein
MTTTRLPIDDPGFIASYGDAWSSRDEAALTAFFAENGIYVEAAMDVTYAGVPDIARFFRFMLAFSPDSTIEFTSFIRQDDRFVAEWVWWGTAGGPLLVGSRRIEPTHRPYVVPGVAVCRVNSDGLVEHHKDYYDLHTLVAQVTGERAAPAPPRPPLGDRQEIIAEEEK